VFSDDSVDEIANTAFQINAEVENIGARRLHTVMSKLLNELLFDVPDKIPADTMITIDANLVKERLTGLIKNKDLSQYIL
jgi:ATP-dependent HslUV protease ATP-binding subunit HslU